MHPALAALSPREARALLADHEALEAWLGRHQIRYRDAIAALGEHGFDEEVAPPIVRPNRPDAGALLAFVDRAVHLPARLRAVATLCLHDGAPLVRALDGRGQIGPGF